MGILEPHAKDIVNSEYFPPSPPFFLWNKKILLPSNATIVTMIRKEATNPDGKEATNLDEDKFMVESVSLSAEEQNVEIQKLVRKIYFTLSPDFSLK